MATTLDFSQTYDAQPSTVRAMITDAEFINLRATKTGSTTVDSEVINEPGGGTTVVVTRTMPANVPS